MNARLGDTDRMHKFRKHYILREDVEQMNSFEQSRVNQDNQSEEEFMKRAYSAERKLSLKQPLNGFDLLILFDRNYLFFKPKDRKRLNNLQTTYIALSSVSFAASVFMTSVVASSLEYLGLSLKSKINKYGFLCCIYFLYAGSFVFLTDHYVTAKANTVVYKYREDILDARKQHLKVPFGVEKESYDPMRFSDKDMVEYF